MFIIEEPDAEQWTEVWVLGFTNDPQRFEFGGGLPDEPLEASRVRLEEGK